VRFASRDDITLVDADMHDGVRPRLGGEAVPMFVASAAPAEEEPEP
jgi:hypothetical protein